MPFIRTHPPLTLLRGRCINLIGLLLCLFTLLPVPAPAQSPPANRVQTTPVEQVVLHPKREVAAVVVARNQSRLSAEVAGTVTRWSVDVGATVRKGDLLVELDPTDHRLARDRAQSGFAAAKARAAMVQQQLQRARELVAQGFFSQEALAARETEVQLANAELTHQRLALASAERNLIKTRVLAPFDASVRERLVQQGETVAPGAPLYILAETTGAEVSAPLSSEQANSLRASHALHFDSTYGEPITLALRRIGTTVMPTSRTVEARLFAPALVPGREGKLVWNDPRPHVPAALLVRRQGALGLFTVNGSTARFLPLPQAQEGRAAPVQLPLGTLLVTQGHHTLHDGDPVHP